MPVSTGLSGAPVSKNYCEGKGRTHHFACDCREKKFESLLKSSKRLLDAMPITEQLYLEKYVEELKKSLQAMEE